MRQFVFGKDIFGNTIVKNNRGEVLLRYETDIFGNLKVKDKNGRIIASIETDIFGHTIVKSSQAIKLAEYDSELPADYSSGLFSDLPNILLQLLDEQQPE